jgi:hypothetical protein
MPHRTTEKSTENVKSGNKMKGAHTHGHSMAMHRGLDGRA